MPKIHIAQQGEMIDEICFLHYGTSRGTTEMVLEANNLIELGLPILAAGQAILLPDIVAEPTRKVIRLWD